MAMLGAMEAASAFQVAVEELRFVPKRKALFFIDQTDQRRDYVDHSKSHDCAGEG
jgi:hypothetical protein